MVTHVGGCQCGAVRYEVTGSAIVVAFCHCRMCQRAHGAPAVPWLVVRRSVFNVTHGTPAEYRSSAKAVRQFCRDCGTPMFFLEDARADQIDIAVSTLDDPIAVPPSRHIWVESQMPWLKVDDGLPQNLRGTT